MGVKIPGLVRAEGVGGDHVERAAGLGLVLVVPDGLYQARLAGDLVGSQAEQEEVFLAGLLGHLDRGAVTGADCQRAVHHELHVAGAAGLESGCRDLLGDVACGYQALGQAHVVFRNEKNLELALGGGIDVDHGGDVVDQLDDQLGQRVSRRRLAGEEEGAGRDIELRVVAQAIE